MRLPGTDFEDAMMQRQKGASRQTTSVRKVSMFTEINQILDAGIHRHDGELAHQCQGLRGPRALLLCVR
jgi:hypothetical protein